MAGQEYYHVDGIYCSHRNKDQPFMCALIKDDKNIHIVKEAKKVIIRNTFVLDSYNYILGEMEFIFDKEADIVCQIPVEGVMKCMPHKTLIKGGYFK